MINQYPLWKYLLLVTVLVVGGIFAMPNIYGKDPSVLVSLRNQQVSAETQQKVNELLSNASIQIKSSELKDNKLLIRMPSDDDEMQRKAADTIKSFDFIERNSDYTVALNLAPATPQWLQSLSALPMYLGLDLRGGVHFLLEVDMQSAMERMERDLASEMRSFLRAEKIRYRGIKRSDGGISIQFKDVNSMEQGRSKLKSQFATLEFTANEADLKVFGKITEVALRDERRSAIQQNVTTLRNRVNELGVAEPVIQQQGENRIVVQLPGIQDTARAKDILGRTATLEFRLTEGTNADWYAAANGGSVPLNAKLYRERNGDPVLLKRRVIVTGDQINGASSTIDTQSGTPAVSVRLDSKGAKKMGETTRENIKKPMAVVFIENKIETKEVNGVMTKVRTRKEEVINIATIQGVFSKQFQITGLESFEARDLALLLRAGALKAPVEIVEERTVGPSLGKDNIEQGFNSVMIGFSLVLIFMVIYYRTFGLIANVALTANLILITAVLSLMQATLTLPGIAGIVLTVGMAVDANVLIFERIREELRIGNSPQASIHAGYEKAFSTIADANVTTFIAAIVLFSLGTGPVKGFAITLSIGILTSMFTAIMGTRALVNLIYGGRNLKKLSI